MFLKNNIISKYLGCEGQEEVWKYWVTNATDCATNYHFVEQAQMPRLGLKVDMAPDSQNKMWIKV